MTKLNLYDDYQYFTTKKSLVINCGIIFRYIDEYVHYF